MEVIRDQEGQWGEVVGKDEYQDIDRKKMFIDDGGDVYRYVLKSQKKIQEVFIRNK